MEEKNNNCEIENYSGIAKKVANVCIICNLLLCVLKLTAGIFASSRALLSDGINSAFDVVSGIIVIVGVKLAEKEADKEHPYGHERLESVAAIILSVILLVTGIFIGYAAFNSLISGDYKTQGIPGTLSIVAAIISIVSKEILFWYTKINGDKINSVSLKAAAWDHRADVISTLGALIGIVFSRMGYLAGDQIASLVVCIFIVRTAYVVFRGAIAQMTDKSCDDDFLRELREYILAMDGVLGIDMLQVRCFGNRYYIDLEIKQDGNKTLHEAHLVAEQVHDAIEKKYPVVKHIMIHVNPEENDG